MRKRFLFGGIIVVILGVVAFALLRTSKPMSNGKTTIVQISASGFSPNAIVVKPGTQIIWKNVDSAPHAVASNPYPSSSSLKELYSQIIPPNGSYAYTVTKAGVITYHDNTQPTHNGSIGVEK